MNERRQNGKDIQGIFVHPGEIVVVQHETVLVSVVSRGVCVCMWDSVTKNGGMSHFMVPRATDPACATARFGNAAVPLLIKIMNTYGKPKDFEGQIFGGATRDAMDTRGSQNAAIAHKVLTARAVPIVSEDVGGSKGRKILFDTASGHVAVLKVHDLRKEDWND